MTKVMRERSAATSVEHKPASRRKKAARTAAPEGKRSLAPLGSVALVRVYRHGLGDCILVRLRKQDGSYYKILIDCGVAVATTDAKSKMTRVVQDVMEASDKEIDLLVLTHQHWDHLSGFLQAEHLFDEMKFGEVLVGWTEDETDLLAKDLKKEHGDALKALAFSVQKYAMAGDTIHSQGIQDILGVAGSGTDTEGAFKKAKSLAGIRFCRPADEPMKLDDTGARLFILGPPHDPKAIRKTLPSKAAPETYELALDGSGVVPCDVAFTLQNEDWNGPFSDALTIPFDVAKGIDFFQNNYWGLNGAGEQWRRIDTDWLSSSEGLALALQSATNNTSLVVAIELSNSQVLLFSADAQVGNCLSWNALTWDVDGKRVTGTDLLDRTIFLKVGHHGSANATLKECVDDMTILHTAVIPVDHEVAVKMRWGNMPFGPVISALGGHAKDRVFRTDDKDVQSSEDVAVTDLYYEFAID